MSPAAIEGYAPIDHREAATLLASASGITPDDEAVVEIAELLGREPPALRWAGALARSLGWRPLRDRLASWPLLAKLVGDAALPWQAEVERVAGGLAEPERNLLAMLAACDGPFAWDVLESVEPTAAIDAVVALEEASLLVRSTSAGVVTFLVPYCVRALHRLTDARATAERGLRWLEAWVKRAEELSATTYGVNARATLAELAVAVPLAERALGASDPRTQALGLALWSRASDAMFFANAVDFASPAFASAVKVADAAPSLEPRLRARLVAGRALLERGDPSRAEVLLEEAIALARESSRDDLRSEALRSLGWAKLASAEIDAATTAFETAAKLSEAAGDPRGRADVAAGRGILALLAGDPDAARALLGEALATHVVTRDAVREGAVRGMMMLLPEQLGEPVDVADLSRQVVELRATGQRWREALVLARLALAARAQGDGASEAAHLLEARAAAALASMPASKLVTSLVDARGSGDATLAVGFEGRSLRLPSGESHDLTRHGPLRRMLWALAVSRIDKPGVAMSTLELVEAGWPGEKMKHEAATLRVYTTVRRLRALGLDAVLMTRDDGYLLDPEALVGLERA